MSGKKHDVFVMGIDRKPLTPTTWKKAKKLIKGGVAKKIWSKLGTFGIQMLVETRKETPCTALGIDHGSRFEGYSIVCGKENNLNVKLDLPNKKTISKKMEERRALRRTRRQQKCRRREARFNNRKRNGFIAPSQLIVVNSRLKVIKELIKIFPIKFVGFEDVCFNHSKHRWGKNFSTIEVGKNKIKNFIQSFDIKLIEYNGWETKGLREKYSYKKISDKSKDDFRSHCCDSLSLAVDTNHKERIEPNQILITVDDTYRSVRRKLYDTKFHKGHIKPKYSRGIVDTIRKGILIGFSDGRYGKFVGTTGNSYYFRKEGTNRLSGLKKNLCFISSNFLVRRFANSSLT